MNSKEFIQKLSKQTDTTAADTKKLVVSLFEELGKAFEEGESVQFNNLGTFEVKKRLEKLMTNPGTKQTMLVPPKLILSFRPSQTMKSKYNKKGEKDND